MERETAAEVRLVPIRLENGQLINWSRLDLATETVVIIELGSICISLRGPAGVEAIELVEVGRQLLSDVLRD